MNPRPAFFSGACLALTLYNHASGAEADQAAELAKQLSNPISSLISVPFQANEDFRMGPTDNGYKFTLNVQPVIPDLDQQGLESHPPHDRTNH
jgi:hypothetical protein